MKHVHQDEDDQVRAAGQAILDDWFGSIDDSTVLDRESEPFATRFRRWYGKGPEIDASIRQVFEPDLDEVVASGRR